MRKLSMILCFFTVLIAVPAWAQDGVITGKVTDASGAVIPGVVIALTSPGVMGARDVITDEQGGYRFNFLPPGAYALKFELPGFRTLVREGIQITAGFTATLNVSLEVATVGETLTVAGKHLLLMSLTRW